MRSTPQSQARISMKTAMMICLFPCWGQPFSIYVTSYNSQNNGPGYQAMYITPTTGSAVPAVTSVGGSAGYYTFVMPLPETQTLLNFNIVGVYYFTTTRPACKEKVPFENYYDFFTVSVTPPSPNYVVNVVEMTAGDCAQPETCTGGDNVLPYNQTMRISCYNNLLWVSIA